MFHNDKPTDQASDGTGIVRTINNCLRNWYEPWKKTYLADGREFKIVYELMEGLLHYEYQITSNDKSVLSSDRLNAIAQAVARLVDYGNAILNIDLVVRASDETEMEPVDVTTIELFQAHLRAHNLREKLLYDYFKKDKPSNSQMLPGAISPRHHSWSYHNAGDDAITPTPAAANSNGGGSGSLTPVSLQVPSLVVGSFPNRDSLGPASPKLERSHRSSIGSNTSINTSISEGSGRPQQLHQIEVSKQKLTNLPAAGAPGATDLNSEIEVTHMTATIRSSAFLASHKSNTRIALLPGILAKIQTLLSVPTSVEKLTNCFELLDALLDSIERLPIESRDKEVAIISTALLKPLVRKVYIDDRDNLVEHQHAHWTTYLLSIVRLMTASDFNTYLRHFSNLADLGAFLKDYLFIVKRLTRSTTVAPTTTMAGAGSSQGDQSLAPLVAIHSDMMADSNSGLGPSTTSYPDCWIEMTLLACSTFLTSLTYLYQVLRQFFQTNLQMWLSFIDCLVHFILQDALKPDRLMLKERQRLLAEDLRQTAAEYVWISWDSLSMEQKQQLLEDLIEPLLRACMTLYSRQRSILLPIFYDMMRCDYTSQYITPRGSLCCNSAASNSPSVANTTTHSQQQQHHRRDLSNGFIYDDEDDLESLPPINSNNSCNQQSNSALLSSSPTKTNDSLPYLSFRDSIGSSGGGEDGTVLTKFTHLIVGKLNTLMIDLGLGEDCFKIELCAAISGELNPKYYANCSSFPSSSDNGKFKFMAKHTADLIAEFMQICLDSRQANRLHYKHLYLLCLFKLILFFRDKVDRTELYLNNLYKLCYLHHAAARYVEAGYTLLDHARTLPWSDRPLENHYRLVTRYFQTSHARLSDYTSLKIFLYNTIMEYFDQGQIWEAAIPLCRELIDVYEFKTYEYEKLAQVLAKMSTYFTNVIGSANNRNNSEYFRVAFYGKGFPVSLRNATMIYRGKPYEKLADFQATILSKYPDARLLNSLAKPDDALLSEPDARYLQINACSPVVDLKSKFGAELSKINESILNYYRHNECDKFSFSRRISRPVNRISAGARRATSGNISTSAGASGGGDNFADMWRERTALTTNTLPGILPFFPVFLIETNIVSPIESAIEDLERTNDRLSCMVNRFKADKRRAEDARLLGQLLLGVVDAAVNGGITKYEEAFFAPAHPGANTTSGSSSTTGATLESNFENSLCVSSPSSSLLPDPASAGGDRQQQHQQQQPSSCTSSGQEWRPSGSYRSIDHADANANEDEQGPDRPPSGAQVDKLKCLIAQQVPLLDEAILLHRDRVAEVMRPQHEHLEASYKRLKHHIMTKYSRYLPADYSRSTIRSYRSLARSPNRSMRSESRLPHAVSASSSLASRTRTSDAGQTNKRPESSSSPPPPPPPSNINSSPPTSNIPYKQLGCERRSLPFLTGAPVADRDLIKDMVQERRRPLILQRAGALEGEDASIAEQLVPVPVPRRSSLKNNGDDTTSVVAIASQMDDSSNTAEFGPKIDIQVIPAPSPPSTPTPYQPYVRLVHNDDDDDDDDGDDPISSSGQQQFARRNYGDDESERTSLTVLTSDEIKSQKATTNTNADEVKLVSF